MTISGRSSRAGSLCALAAATDAAYRHESALLPRNDRGRQPTGGGEPLMRNYELMVILDPDLEERTVQPSLERYLKLVTDDGGTVESFDLWGRRHLAYDIDKRPEGIYAVVTMTASPETIKELDRQLTLNESVLRTKVIRPGSR
jgi:small subunit ribosomal protein S6